MAERNERPMFEGKNRRVSERRQAERSYADKVKTVLKYLAVVIITLVAIKLSGL